MKNRKRSQSQVSYKSNIETRIFFYLYKSSERRTFGMSKRVYIPEMYMDVVTYMYKNACMRTHIYMISSCADSSLADSFELLSHGLM